MEIGDYRRLQAILRSDFPSFIEKSFYELNPSQIFELSWHILAIADALERVRRGELTRLIICLPPRHLKSVIASVALPAWILGHDPGRRTICASYGAGLAEKFALDCRTIMSSRWYQDTFQRTRLSPQKSALDDFMTTARGGRLSTSVGGTLTGRGGDILILDDPMKPDEALSSARRESVCAWYDNVAYSRLDDKRTGAIVIVMQRLHLDDLVGHVLRKGENWHVLNLSAIAPTDQKIQIGTNRFHFRREGDLLVPNREPLEVLERTRSTIGHYAFSAQYLQEPIPVEGEILKWKWFGQYDSPPARDHNAQVIQSWDTASKAGELNDYSVCTTWLVKDGKYYLLDIFRKKLIYPDLRRAIIQHAEKWKPNAVLIEDKASGMALAQDFKPFEISGVHRPIAIEPEDDKIMRAAAQSTAIEAGQVLLPKSAPWLAAFRDEIVQFPAGRHDDQIDSMCQLLAWVRRRRPAVQFARLQGL